MYILSQLLSILTFNFLKLTTHDISRTHSALKINVIFLCRVCSVIIHVFCGSRLVASLLCCHCVTSVTFNDGRALRKVLHFIFKVPV